MTKTKTPVSSNADEPKVTHIGKLEPLQVEELRKKHSLAEGEITHIVVHSANGDTAHHAYLKTPDRNITARALTLFTQDKRLESGEVLLLNCWISGDESIKKNDKLLMSAAMKATASVDWLETELEKL